MIDPTKVVVVATPVPPAAGGYPLGYVRLLLKLVDGRSLVAIKDTFGVDYERRVRVEDWEWPFGTTSVIIRQRYDARGEFPLDLELRAVGMLESYFLHVRATLLKGATDDY